MCTSSAFRWDCRRARPARACHADDRAEPIDERGGRLARRATASPTASMAEQPVGVDGRYGNCPPAQAASVATRTKVVLGGRQPDPVFERIHRGGRCETFAHEE
jgi:hypothetical protein